MSIWLWLKKSLFVGPNVVVGSNFHVGLLSWVSASKHLSIGKDVYIGKFCSIQCNGCIGDGVLIANNVGVVGRVDHDFKAVGVTVRRSPHVSVSAALRGDTRNQIQIGSDTWIGFGSVIISGISIGRGAIIAAGSVVTMDVMAYDIVAGNPAKAIGRRFTDDEIVKHESMLAKGTSIECSPGTLKAPA